MAQLNVNERDEVEDIAEKYTDILLAKTGLKTLKDPFDKFSYLNQTIENIILIRFPVPEEHGNLSGFSYNVDKYKCIFINSGHTLGRQYCSFWHEIYHTIDDSNDANEDININCEDINIVCEDENCEDEKDLAEKKASYFSYCMLLPEKDVRNYIISLSKKPTNLSFEEIVKMQFHFRTSLEVLLFRLVEIYNSKYFFVFKKYSSKDNIEEYHKIVKKLGLSTDLIVPTNDYIVPKEFFKDVYDNLYNKRISFEKAQKLVNIINDKGIKGLW